MNTRRGLVALVAAGALVLSGCGSDAGRSAPNNAPAAKTGGGPDAITITVADSEPKGRPSNLPLDEFARQVASLSHGSMKVEILTEAGGDAAIQGGDQAVIKQLRDRGFDMAVMPARAWSTAGVSSMQSLQTPFLVESNEQLNAIVRDQAVVTSLLSGLDAVGVHGLTMFPESLRHLFSFSTPILTPADVVGRQIRYVASPDVAALLAALGATPVDPSGEDFAAGVSDGTITAADSGYAIALDSTPRPAIATGNVVLYAKVITLVANSAFWDGLSDTQRDALNTAADRTQDWAISNQISENAAATQYCAGGGSVVLTQPDNVAQFRAVVAPIYAELERDATTKEIITAIDALAPATPSTPITACGPASATALFHQDGGELPNGVYRIEMSDEFLRSHHINDADVLDAHGVFTWRLEDGRWSVDQANDTPRGPTHGEGIYDVDGNTLSWQWNPDGGAIEQFTWSADEDGTLHFSEVDPIGEGDLFFLQPWPRIGDL